MTGSLAARARLYGWLSRLFAPPTGAPGPRRLAVAALRASGDSRVAEAAAAVERHYPGGDQTDLLVAYTSLFVGAGRVLASPYASVHRDGGILMGPSTQAVVDEYLRAGLAVAPSSAELPDHISLMLGFLHVVTLREAVARRQGQTQEAEGWAAVAERFEREQVAPWAPSLADAVRQADLHPLYGAAAALLLAWVERL